MKMVPQEERQKRIAAWLETTLPGALLRLEKLSPEGCMVGSQLSWADICVFNRLNQLFDIDADVLHADFPKLRACTNGSMRCRKSRPGYRRTRMTIQIQRGRLEQTR